MEISRLSSTSLEVATQCMARFKAEYVDGVKGPQGNAAQFGSCVHDTLEYWVTAVYVDYDASKDNWDSLKTVWQIKFTQYYGSLSDKENLALGEKLLKRWYDRGDLRQPGREVIELENKKRFPITVDGHEIAFTYIIDRLDRIEDDGLVSIVVVDYKTSAWGVSPEELREVKIQPRMYALAIQMEYPEADGIWVEFDMLKHENQPVGVYFSKEDNRNTLRALREEIRKILAAPDNPKPTLNDTCLFCPIKATCPATTKLAQAGGAMGLSAPEMVDRVIELEYAEKAIKAARSEIEKNLIEIAKESDVMELTGHNGSTQVTMSRRRTADAERIANVIGPELWAKYGSPSISVSKIDELLKSGALPEDKVAEVKEYITYTYGEPRIKAVKAKTLPAI